MAKENGAEPEPGRRQAHKQRTVRSLQQAALELFAEQGYDTTTTDDISERAGVSPRTFFRYFPTKESVLFVGEYGWLQSFTSQFLAQPDDLSDLDAIRATFDALARELRKIRKALTLYERAVASSPTLRGGVFDHQQQDIAMVADAIATRRGLDEPDVACVTLATFALITYRSGMMRWLHGPASAEPQDAIRESFEVVLAELAPTPPQPTRRGGRRKVASAG